MRIAILCETYLPCTNGVVTHIKVLSDGLKALGHEVLIVTADANIDKQTLTDGVLYCPGRPVKRLYGYSVARPFSKKRMKALAEFQPDVIHIHQEFGIGYFGVRAAKKLNVPLVYTLHTMYDDYAFYVAHKPFQPLACKIFYHYVHHIANRSTVLTSPSPKAKDFFAKCKVDKDVTIIPNSVELSAFDECLQDEETLRKVRKDMRVQPDCRTAIFVGRLGAEKSVDDLLRFWAESLNPAKDKVHLVIIGDGPDKADLIQLARILGIERYVTFMGRVEHEHIMPMYCASDMFVSASLSEMMSISMLEAMAAGLPVIQRFDERNAGQIKQGINGFVYETAEEMGGFVRNLAALSEEERLKVRAQVRKSVASAGAKQSGEHLEGVYRRAIQEKKDADARLLAEKMAKKGQQPPAAAPKPEKKEQAPVHK